MKPGTIGYPLTVCQRYITFGLRFARHKAAMERLGVPASWSGKMPFMPTVRARHGLLVLLAALAVGPACAGDVIFIGDFEYSTQIESLRYDNTSIFPGDSVDLAPALVTATWLTSDNTKIQMFLQASPQWGAIEAYGDTLGQPPAVGDCVRVKGTFANFNGSLEISPMTWWADANPLDCLDDDITPAEPTVDQVATDTDPGMAGNQPGFFAESFQSALVTLQDVTVLTTSDHNFEVYDEAEGTGVYLSVDDHLYHYDATVGTHFSSITGVLNENDSSGQVVYQLLPRSASDIVVGP